MWNQNNDTTISGKTSEDFRLQLNKLLKEDGYDIDNDRYPAGYQEAPLAYDAVWAVALGKLLIILMRFILTNFSSISAFNKTMEKLNLVGKSLKQFTYTDKEIADEIYAAINTTQFLGVSVSSFELEKKKAIIMHVECLFIMNTVALTKSIFSRRVMWRSARKEIV